jgi:HSP20 family protein
MNKIKINHIIMLDSFSSLLRQMDLAERMYMQDSKTSTVYLPNTDIVEGKDEWIIISEIPGVKKEDISISFEDSMLKLEAKKELIKKQSKDGDKLSEIQFGSYKRTFKLASDVDSSKIEASYENGVLELTIPKKKEKAKQFEIKIK